MNLILPGNPLFDFTLDTAMQPGWQDKRNISTGGIYVIKGENGLMRPATASELDDYLLGGEYDEVTKDDTENGEILLPETDEGWYF